MPSNSGVQQPWMRCGDFETKLACHSGPIEGNADVRAYKRGRAEAVKYRNSNAPVFSLGLLSDVPWTAAKPFLCVQTEKTHTFALCFRASFSSILGGTYLSVHMGGLLWPQDTGLWTLVVVSMEMSRTWGGIQLTGNTVYCWLSGMGKEGGSVCGERRGGGWGWGWGLAPCWWNEDLNITVLLISQVRWDETKQRNPTGFSFFSVGIKKK